jgi:hypothetical protein
MIAQAGLLLIDISPDDPLFDQLPKFKVDDLVAEVNAKPEGIFTYENVGGLARVYSTKDGIDRALAAKLRAAQTADEAGDYETRNAALEDFRSQLEAQLGKTLTAQQAETLEILSRVLQTNP